jgi:glycosyltransferase involved in cell wall biosynthesis
LISVLLPFRDAAPTIAEALESTLADLDDADEVIAVDDRSTDGGARIVERIAGRDRRVVSLRSSGEGIVPALRTGLASSRGDLVARMDADDVVLPGRFATSLALFDADPSLAVAAVRVEPFGEVTEGIAHYIEWQNAILTKEDHAASMFVESPITHPSVTIRRDALEAAGGFGDPPWPEDWDLWLRLNERSFAIAKAPAVHLRWRRHARTLTTNDARYSMVSMLACRAHYLARRLGDRPFAIWGAGQTGRRLARALEAHDKRPLFFIDIDPRKKTARDRPVVPPEEGLARNVLIVVAVGQRGARDIVRARIAGDHILT